MRVTFLNTYDNKGGAARAAFRLFSGISNLPDVEAVFVTREKKTANPKVVEDRSRRTRLFGEHASVYDQRPLKREHPHRRIMPFSVNRLADTVHETIHSTYPNIVHLHWLNAGFVRLESLTRIGVPIVWTLHDMWPFTGVCHYSLNCLRYLEGCGCCPLLASDSNQDISAATFARKQKVYSKLNLTVVTPSAWLGKLAASSPLFQAFPIHVIPNGLDTSIFHPWPKFEARRILNLPFHSKLILFGADHALTNPFKGGRDFVKIFAANAPQGTELVIFGTAERKKLDTNIHSLGTIDNDIKLAQLYSACDLYAYPSQQDNLPNTVMEAMACGTPVLAFAIGGIPEMIDHCKNGFLVKSMDMNSFWWSLEKTMQRGELQQLGAIARQKVVQKFSYDKVAKHYMNIYHNVTQL